MPTSSSPAAAPACAQGPDPGARVLVFGATGYIGAHLVPRLLREGCVVRASGRNRKVLEARGWLGAELVEADALMPDSLPAVLAGVDTAYYLVRVAALDEAAGRILDAAGPDYLSYEDVMRQYGEVVGRRPWIVPVPVLTPELSARWLGLIIAVPTNVARALIGGLKHDLPADDAELRRLVPQRLLSFREAVQAALQAERNHAVAARWSEGLLMFRGFRLDHAFYAKRASGSALGVASPAALWHTVATLGGDNGYYTMDWLWWLRGAMDWLVGGSGLSRGRRHPTELRIGDRVDYWTVLALEPGRRLTLNFGMRASGSGVLEFEIKPEAAAGAGQRTRLTISAYWHAQGVWGLLYWYALTPAHLFIFRRMTRAMMRRVEELDAGRGKRLGAAG